jgi:anthranilate synthase component 2
MRVLVIDNYDSFTFNLVQHLGELGAKLDVVRNDAVTPDRAIDKYRPERLVISPGPGRPEDGGYSIEYVKALGSQIPILGVCLGHQAIVVAFGGKVDLAPAPKHGKTSQISHDGRGIFTGIESPFVATRYHSLAAVELPEELEVSATSEEGVVQGVRHRSLPIDGVQFHPESVMTEVGKSLLKNFLEGV